MLERDHKFYSAFENSNCREHATEKFFETGLGQNNLPIVLGAPNCWELAPRADFNKFAPEQSYLHVEDFKPLKELADSLHVLDKNVSN